jgi:hypothetical protein
MGKKTPRFVRRNWGYLLLIGAVILLLTTRACAGATAGFMTEPRKSRQGRVLH